MYVKLLGYKKIVGKVLNVDELKLNPWLNTFIIRYQEKDSRLTFTRAFHKSEVEIVEDLEINI